MAFEDHMDRWIFGMAILATTSLVVIMMYVIVRAGVKHGVRSLYVLGGVVALVGAAYLLGYLAERRGYSFP